MTMDFANAYAVIIKQEKQEDGSLLVYGKATDDSIDMDQQICDPTWLDRAMPEWFKSGGNIREQHSNIAAGVAKEYEAKTDGHYISALVVDPISVKKVEAGVLKGFSIGIKAPRVVRDTKAVNGRIIDGQIIEVSLVDRPANPNAKLIMAKSVEGETSLVQVEELHEYKAPLPSEVVKTTKKGSKMETIKQITELAKSLTPDSVKFDKALFDTAVKAIADLIVVEAGEISADNSERDSIENLLDALKHLRNWYEGEVEEGEVQAPMNGDLVELSADAETTKSDECACECDACGSNKGCDSKMCKCNKAVVDDAVMSVDKCLECGCHKPADAHGRADVTTAEMVAPDETPKSAEADQTPVAEEAAVEVVAEAQAEVAAEEVSEVDSSDAPSIEDVVEKAVKSAMESVKAEIDALRAEKESVVEKSVKLETELATALSKSVAGGPKRTSTNSGAQSNEYLVKAATYKAKADATTDPVLAKGYRALYAEFSAKAGLPVDTENEQHLHERNNLYGTNAKGC